MRVGDSDRTPWETVVSTPAKRPDPDKGSSVVEAILAAVNSRAVTLAPGGVVGTGIYLHTGQVRLAFLTCVLGPPAAAGGKVLADWVRLLAPPRRWRRPQRRGS
jgi:hypothetical protein